MNRSGITYFSLVLLFLTVTPLWVSGQKFVTGKLKEPIICYATDEDHDFYLPPPTAYRQMLEGARVKTATITVEYGAGFTLEARAAFQAAVDIWESLITSSVPIRIQADWGPMTNASALGAASYTYIYPNFDGAQKLNTYYPVALAERILGEELNPSDEPDIYAVFNSTKTWHFDPNTEPPSGAFDLVTVVLHEIGHGLGFSSSFVKSNSSGSIFYSNGAPIVYDAFVQNGPGAYLVDSFVLPSGSVAAQLTGNDLFINTPVAGKNKLYAPSTFSPGSSVSHLDDATFNGTGDALMTHAISPVERIHDPGVALQILEDLGWGSTTIKHKPLPNTEDITGPYSVTVKIIPSNVGYDANSVTLHYTTDGTTFTDVVMSPTANPDEYTAEIGSLGIPATYGYYLSVVDQLGRIYLNPGKVVTNGQGQSQHLNVFDTGPDEQAPVILHSQKPFLITLDSELRIDATITDNIGIESAVVSYFINGIQQADAIMVLQDPVEDNVYTTTIAFSGPLQDGDLVEYFITATDNSSNSNVTVSPSSGNYVLNVVGLLATQDFYENDFNSPTTDFFGTGFSVTTPSGFTDGAIHSDHPYQEANGLPGDTLNLLYQLRIPIRVADVDALISFDEIVLIEPGENNIPFGNADFYDYVVVEGSTDGGITWEAIADGYDSRDNPDWLTKYNSSTSGNNSTATGTPSLYKKRIIDLLDRFNPGDEVVIRFKLFSDPFAAGWGWAIDNLKIQIDQKAPTVYHDHHDYVLDTLQYLPITTFAEDVSGIKQLKIEFFVNDQPKQDYEFTLDPLVSAYTLLLDMANLGVGDVIHYRIVALDNSDIEGTFPLFGKFINVPIIQYDAPVATYASNFDGGNTDFVGNFFSIETPSGFSNSAIHTDHSYPLGAGFSGASDFTFTLKKPVLISAINSYVRYDQVVIVEGRTGSAVFGDPGFNDYVVIEGSNDGGETWIPFEDGLDAFDDPLWKSVFNSNGEGSGAYYRRRLINMLSSGDFKDGEQVLIRFRLHSNNAMSGWGWAIDNLYIQDVITAAESLEPAHVSIFPVPFSQSLSIQIEQGGVPQKVQIMNGQGQILFLDEITENGTKKIDTSQYSPGLYIVKVFDGEKAVIRKVIKLN